MIKKYIRNNFILADFFDSYYNHSIKKRRIINGYVKKFARIDSIDNYVLFKKTVQKLLKHHFLHYTYDGRYEAVWHYGYYQEILRYASYKRKAYPILTGLDHGVRFGKTPWIYKDYHVCYVCQGANRTSEITDIDRNMPVLTIGPYIHYSSFYYDDEKFKEVKKKYGKTLLVFPGHTTEWESNQSKHGIFDIVWEKYAKDYKTVMVCTYWLDILNDEIKKFEENGAVIVSAGFRQDPNFVRRLKTIIELSDQVISNDIGTNIGYCLYLKKPFILEGELKVFSSDDTYTKNYEKFYEAFHKRNDGDFTDNQRAMQLKLYEEFWGSNEIKSKEELNQYIKLFDKLIRVSDYNPETLRKLIIQEDRWNAYLTQQQRELLKSTLAR